MGLRAWLRAKFRPAPAEQVDPSRAEAAAFIEQSTQHHWLQDYCVWCNEERTDENVDAKCTRQWRPWRQR